MKITLSKKVPNVLSNIIKVTFSRGLSLLSSIAIGFIIPKALGITGFGFYKIFTLYSSYVILLHFGFIDGILLKFAGANESELDLKEFRTYTSFFVKFQLLFTFILIIGSFLFLHEEYCFIGCMLGLNMFLLNMTSYFQSFSQAIERFNELSIRNILSAIFKLTGALSALALYYFTDNIVNYHVYIYIVNLIAFVLLLWYLHTYKIFIFGPKYPLITMKKELLYIFKIGFSTTTATQIGHLVLMMDRQFVSVLYSTEVYSLYAFAYSIIAIFTALISESAKVLFPMLKKMDKESAMKLFSKIMYIIILIAGFSLLGYYPLSLIVRWFLPEYINSLEYLKVVLPALLPSSCISIVMFTFYKVLGKNQIYLLTGILSFIIGFISNSIAQFVFSTPISISWASVITMIIWYIMTVLYLSKVSNEKWIKNFLMMIFIMVGYYLIYFYIELELLASLIYLIYYFVIMIVYYFINK